MTALDAAKKRLIKITIVWNNYILNECYNKNKINYKNRHNDYAEILNYFLDTFESIAAYNEKSSDTSFGDALLLKIGLLQILYVHQDLIREMTNIFGTKEVDIINRKELRNLRNELVGHPICRDKEGDLISSVLWDYNDDIDNISYTKYYYKIDKTEEIKHKIEDILEKHNDYLIYNFNEIYKKQKKIINIYKTKMQHLKKMIENQVDKQRIIGFVKDYMNNFSKMSFFTVETMKKAVSKYDDDERYRIFYEYFLVELGKHVDEVINNIDELINEKKYNEDKDAKEKHVIIIDIITDSTDEVHNISEEEKRKDRTQYCMSKLSEIKYLPKLRVIDVMEKMYKNNENIVKYLNELKKYKDDDFEYDISYVLLKNELPNQENDINDI